QRLPSSTSSSCPSIMAFVNAILNSAVDLLLAPFAGLGPWSGLIAFSCVVAAGFVWLFRVCSDQQALQRKKGRMFARALELLLYRHDMLVSLTAFPRIAAANAGYFRELLRPIAVAVVPSVLLLIQLASWYENRPLAVGEAVLLSADLSSDFPVMEQRVELQSSDELQVETAGLRVPTLNQINWRLRANRPGSAWIELQINDEGLRKSIIIAEGMARVSDRRLRAGFWNELLHPTEPSLPRQSPVEMIRVHYPQRTLFLGEKQIPWIIAFLVLTMVFGLLFGRVFRVSF
ncbi:MAG: hypothetical protein KF861_16630, partial [Planctomycetaceae bacterium]|nr:hypothetical protein [Planctomycetaceae bacterium]